MFALIFVFFVTGNVWCFNLTLTWKDASPDGIQRPVIFVNEVFPGPLIRATEGDEFVVDVLNLLPEDVTIHYHGILQKGTSFMDGVPYVSQYPIKTGQTFRYKFNTDGEYGTYWYHAHTPGLYADGIFGPLVIDPKPERTVPFTYDDERIVMISDWYSTKSNEIITMIPHMTPNCIRSILLNGKGRVYCVECMDHMNMHSNAGVCQETSASLERITVPRNKTIMIRFINSAALTEFEVSIDEHDLTVVEADGTYLKNPQIVNKIRITVGQRYAVLIKTDKIESNYWIRASRYNVDAMVMQNIEGKAILTYEITNNNEPNTTDWENGTILNENLLSPYESIPPPNYSNKTFYFNITSMTNNIWTINGEPFTEPSVPMIFQKFDKNKVVSI
jgi:FtsP/CotA-like multicopper oxidase with cupredoxin domain